MVPFKSLSLIYSFKCNQSCSHCINHSSPQRKGKLGVARAKEAIDVAAKYGAKAVTISGGEVTLFLKDLKKIIAHARAKGVFPTVMTNGCWAKNEKSADAMVRALAGSGLRHMILSTDIYHSKYTPVSNIIRAFKACEKYRVKHSENVLITKNEKASKKIVETLEAAGGKVRQTRLVLKGRAVEELPNEVYLYRWPIDELSCNGCPVVLRPTVEPNGDVYSCPFCVPNEFGKNIYHYLGNMKQQRFETLVQRAMNDRIFEKIHKLGGAQVYKKCEKELKKAGFKPFDLYNGSSGLCVHLLSDPEYVRVISNADRHWWDWKERI